MEYKNAYKIIENHGVQMTPNDLHSILTSFMSDYLMSVDYEVCLRKHRNPLAYHQQLLKSLNTYLSEIQNRPEMRYTGNNEASFVQHKLREIFESDKTIKSLYALIEVYCERENKNFIEIAIHVAEFRAVYKLYNKIYKFTRLRNPNAEVKSMPGYSRIRVTRITKSLNFQELAWDDFERMIYAFLRRHMTWDSLEWLGQTGADKGKDVWGVRNLISYCYQCANYKRLTFAKATQDIKRLIDTNNIPNKLFTVCGGRVSSSLRERLIAFGHSSGIAEITIISGVELEEQIRFHCPEILPRFFEGEVFPEFTGNQLDTAAEKSKAELNLENYRQLFVAQFSENQTRFVHFNCVLDENEIHTSDIRVGFASKKHTIIFGQSGQGKSLLAEKLANNYVKEGGTPVILEAKYYDTTLDALLKREVTRFGFHDSKEFLNQLTLTGNKLLVVIDGLNECSIANRGKLIAELMKLVDDYGCDGIITTQIPEGYLERLDASWIAVKPPTTERKRAIVAKYSGREL